MDAAPPVLKNKRLSAPMTMSRQRPRAHPAVQTAKSFARPADAAGKPLGFRLYQHARIASPGYDRHRAGRAIDRHWAVDECSGIVETTDREIGAYIAAALGNIVPQLDLPSANAAEAANYDRRLPARRLVENNCWGGVGNCQVAGHGVADLGDGAELVSASAALVAPCRPQ